MIGTYLARNVIPKALGIMASEILKPRYLPADFAARVSARVNIQIGLALIERFDLSWSEGKDSGDFTRRVKCTEMKRCEIDPNGSDGIGVGWSMNMDARGGLAQILVADGEVENVAVQGE